MLSLTLSMISANLLVGMPFANFVIIKQRHFYYTDKNGMRKANKLKNINAILQGVYYARKLFQTILKLDCTFLWVKCTIIPQIMREVKSTVLNSIGLLVL